MYPVQRVSHHSGCTFHVARHRPADSVNRNPSRRGTELDASPDRLAPRLQGGRRRARIRPSGPCSCPEQADGRPCYLFAPRALHSWPVVSQLIGKPYLSGVKPTRRAADLVPVPCAKTGWNRANPLNGDLVRDAGCGRRWGERAAAGRRPASDFPSALSVRWKHAAARARPRLKGRRGRTSGTPVHGATGRATRPAGCHASPRRSSRRTFARGRRA